MVTFLLYIVKSTCCLTLFYLGYKALLSNETFFRFNRMVLLAGMLVCMLLPFVELRTESPGVLQMPLLQLEEMIQEGVGETVSQHSVVQVGTEVVPAVREASGSWGEWAVYLYLVGMAVVLCRLVRSFVSLLWLIRSGDKIRKGRYTLVLVGRPVAPFNWGSYIVLSLKDYCDYPNEILTHEQVHWRKHHSLDLIYTEAVVLLHWFNPAAWLLKRELQEVHEYQADTGVLKNGIDATKYQLLLVKKAVSASSYTFANSFNHSKIKKRITMMLKGKSNNWARLKLLLLVPVGLIVLNAFARPEVNRQLETLVQSKDKETPPEEQQDMKSFFKTELESYIKKVDPQTRFEPDEIIAFMKKNTEPKDLFINAKGDVLLNNDFANYKEKEQFLGKLQDLFEKSKKPVSFYFLIDINTPEEATEAVLHLVKEAFDKRQKVVGADKAPFLLFEDARNNKNFPGKGREKKQDVVYYTVDGKQVSPKAYEELKKNFKQIKPRKSDLVDIKGKVVEIHTYMKLEDGSTIPSPALYAEISEDDGTAYPVLISYRTASFESGVYEATLSKKMENVKATAERISKEKEKVEELTVLPANKDVPLSYLEAVKQVLEGKGLSCTIKNKVPDGIK